MRQSNYKNKIQEKLSKQRNQDNDVYYSIAFHLKLFGQLQNETDSYQCIENTINSKSNK
ncbi:MAG: hypothetical protein SFY32_14365 [Bacteroidota bacterium]|nr:hypothetical protein [Bacteroidota bacterium]